jgi:hypothetical protein
MKRAKKRVPSDQRYIERLRKKWTARHGQPYPKTVEERYHRGDRSVLLEELLECLTDRKSIPEWLRFELMKAIAAGRFFCSFDTWDHVFGPPCETANGRAARGKTRAAEWNRRLLEDRIYDFIERRKVQGEKVDRALFEKVAASFGIGRARAEQIYYDSRALVEAARAMVADQSP